MAFVNAPFPHQTFIVRVTGTRDAGYVGIVERVRTGEKHRFQSLKSLGVLIEWLITESKDSAECARETSPIRLPDTEERP